MLSYFIVSCGAILRSKTAYEQIQQQSSDWSYPFLHLINPVSGKNSSNQHCCHLELALSSTLLKVPYGAFHREQTTFALSPYLNQDLKRKRFNHRRNCAYVLFSHKIHS
ncbi:hypothetical protein VCUG_00727 [Vavraia culicis subsp. floridensis]|uniref:Uncharacterized protein n=1 Tax=Vavraia culicis (isolate floridensis) TaxID=948595 RepID=L2GVR2_VAVCU|nr:uncharacterized protein VCUG_00727 [Vavraia culicis subsp. floridensis]ELA47766.1 hypothetical protein VCUG_00727 [Vavraia culicis subsp. floridensis]